MLFWRTCKRHASVRLTHILALRHDSYSVQSVLQPLTLSSLNGFADEASSAVPNPWSQHHAALSARKASEPGRESWLCNHFHAISAHPFAPVLARFKHVRAAPLAPAAAAAKEPVEHGAGRRRGGRREAGGQNSNLQWDRQDGGRGRGHGRCGPSRGTRTVVLRDIADLRTLVEVVEEEAPAWVAAGDVVSLRAAFSALARLGSRPGANTRLLPRALTTLAAAYLPLVPVLGDAFSCVAPLYSCAKLGFWEGQLPAALLERLGRDGGELMQRANGQGHSNLWWSVSAAPQHLIPLAGSALNASAVCLEQMRPSELDAQACSNILLACARLQHRHDPLLHHLTACLVQLPDAKCQNLANTLYALGKLAEECGYRPQQDLRSLADRVLERLPQQRDRQHEENRGYQGQFIPQELSNMLLGCAKLGFSDPNLVHSLATALVDSSQRTNEQDVANALYALAVLGCTGPKTTLAMTQLFAEVQRRLHITPTRFVPQDLSNLLWALERLRPEGQEALMEALAAECRRRQFAGFKPQELSNAAWALARMGFSDQGWYEALVAAVMAPGAMRGAKPQDCANLWYALALVRHRPPGSLMEAMAWDKQRPGPLANSQNCSNLLWSLATLGLYHEQLVEGLVGRLGELTARKQQEEGEASREGPTNQNLANSLWALAVMGPQVLSRHSSLVEGLLREVVRRWEQQQGQVGFTQEGLAQLWQVQLELQHVSRGRGGSRKGLSRLELILAGGAGSQSSLLGAMRRAASREERLDPHISKLQQTVVKAIQQLLQPATGDGDGARHADDGNRTRSPFSSSRPLLAILPEHPVEELCCRVDVVVEVAGGKRVAVEVDGPSHFLANHPHTRTKNGPTQLRDRQLEWVFRAGNVVSVPYWEWNKLKGREGRLTYLSQLLGLQQ
ncbi:hypothetical protein Agub_g1968 [Astrephomene gubernaculifera]|uniref:RAP domain-containing protein n=1 Tax=Astrephomene gubernaculifera TaxID=47775 RepID=A0AAD3DGU5_9CHLO|nr:hypothetical protein Agub_g1968 [Astrephomene gubernaculifera]